MKLSDQCFTGFYGEMAGSIISSMGVIHEKENVAIGTGSEGVIITQDGGGNTVTIILAAVVAVIVIVVIGIVIKCCFCSDPQQDLIDEGSVAVSRSDSVPPDSKLKPDAS